MVRKVYTHMDLPPRVVISEWSPSKTRQDPAKYVDINYIVDQYTRTGHLPRLKDGVYADLSEMGDYRESLEQIRMADELFASMPSKIRAEFDNDPAKFIEFVTDPENTDRMVEMGLATARSASAAAGAPDPDSQPQSSSESAEDAS